MIEIQNVREIQEEGSEVREGGYGVRERDLWEI